MKINLMIMTFFITTSLLANEKSLAAHEHGNIKLGIAIEKNMAEIDLEGPSESFISFEYLPKTTKEKKIFHDAKDLWEKNFFSLLRFDSKLNCKVSEASFKQIVDEKETKEEQAKIKDPKKKEAGVHSDINATAKISCAAKLAGSNLQISLRKYFKNIKKLTAEGISSEVKTFSITEEVQTIKI